MRSDSRFRRTAPVALAAALVGALAAATAARADDAYELALVFAPSASYSDFAGVEVDSAYGLGLGWAWSEVWGIELRGLYSDDDGPFTRYEQRSFELGLRRAFLPAAAWRPYALAGARYRDARWEADVICVQQVGAPCDPLRQDDEAVGPMVGGGVDWHWTEAAALRFDGRLSVYDSDLTGSVEEDLDLSLGLVFRF